MNIEAAASMLDALGSPVWLRIFRLLSEAGEDGMSVGTLVTTIGIPGSPLSHHLAKLAEARLVRQDRHAATLVCHAMQRLTL